MKQTLLLLLLCSGLAMAQQRYSSIRIPLSESVDVATVARLGFPLEEARVKPGNSIELWAGDDDRRLLEKHGIAYSVLIPEWDRHYADRMRGERLPSMQALVGSRAAQFRLGSMGGHLTLEEFYQELDRMRAAAPALLSANDTIGRTIEGRPIVAVTLTASPDSASPSVLYTALHHAREPEGLMALMYFMWYLIEQYPGNPEIHKLLDRAALVFVPVVNPDGYAYNQAQKPQGGGMWRKNRRPFGPAFGVDLNRNYGYRWGNDNTGSSPDSSRDNYRGPSGFSEAETATLRDFCNRKHFQYALNYHTYGNLLIFPWGYSDRDTRDSVLFRSLSERLTLHNRYTWGTGRQTVNYLTNGDSDDWMYGDTTAHRPIIALTPEIGNYPENFWAPPSRILALADEQLEANIQLAHMAVPHVRLATSDVQEDATGVTLLLGFAGATATGRIDSLSVVVDGPLVDTDPSRAAVVFPQTDPLALRLAKLPGVTSNGDPVRVFLTISTDESVMRDSVFFHIGNAQTLLADGAEQSDVLWVAGGRWGRQANDKARGGFCYTESPAGNSINRDSSFLTLRRPLDLRTYVAAQLRFVTKWFIESNNDYGLVEVRAGSDAWTPLTGRYTSKAYGASKQVPVNTPGYDGLRRSWADETMDLTPWCGRDSVQLRFNFQSDEGTVFDGWLVDSIAVLAWQSAISHTADVPAPALLHLSPNTPNPFASSTQLVCTLSNPATLRVQLRDALGRLVRTLIDGQQSAGQFVLHIDEPLAPGVYMCTAEIGEGTHRETAVRMVVKVRR
ncbi:MAG: immune inhibitor A [Ignavibacteriae bacterium]|nr:immune inhibitor A [Ignavibacteriota bacterium]